MRIARFTTGADPRFAMLQGEGDAAELHVLRGDPMYTPVELTGQVVPMTDEVRLLAPVIPRSKVVCVGRNYAEHAAEMGGEAPARAADLPQAEHLGDRPGRPDRAARPDDRGAPRGRAGRGHRATGHQGRAGRSARWTRCSATPCANDVTARDAQRSDGQWTRAKGFDTSCPLGPWLVTGLDVDDLAVTARVNGELRQDGRTSQMLFSVAHLISYISEVMTLLPGDVILTGTPAGVGPIEHGDVVECEIEGIGMLRNPVVRRD